MHWACVWGQALFQAPGIWGRGWGGGERIQTLLSGSLLSSEEEKEEADKCLTCCQLMSPEKGKQERGHRERGEVWLEVGAWKDLLWGQTVSPGQWGPDAPGTGRSKRKWPPVGAHQESTGRPRAPARVRACVRACLSACLCLCRRAHERKGMRSEWRAEARSFES